MTLHPPALLKRLVAIALAVSLAACAGARVSPPLPASNVYAAAKDAASGTIVETPQRKHRGKGRLSIRIRIPKERRHSHYLSAATKGMTMAFTGPTTMTQFVNLTPNDPRCKGTPLTCTIVIALLVGDYTVTIDTYDKAPVNGNIPAGANPLSTAKDAPFTINAGAANRIGITLDGIPQSFVVTPPSGTAGTAFGSPQPFSVTAKDADGDIITGTYENPVTLADSDASGATSVATSGSDSPPAGKLLGSSDSARLNYTGLAIEPATITASAAAATDGLGVFTPVLQPIVYGGPLSGSTPQVTLVTQGSSATFGATENGWTNAPYNHALTATAAADCSTIGTVSQTSGSSFTARTVASPGVGDCTAAVTDPFGQSVSVTLAVVNGLDVTLNTDAALGGTPGACPAGANGDLRFAVCSASAGSTIVFNCGTPCTIKLGAPLPPIEENLNIDGGTFGNVAIDGNALYRAFFVDTGTVTIANLQIQHVLAQGGAGGSAGGGGGAGLGAGIFVNQAGAAVDVSSVFFTSCRVAGGPGGGTVIAGGVDGGGIAFAGGVNGGNGGPGGPGSSGTPGNTGGDGGPGGLGGAGGVGGAGGTGYFDDGSNDATSGGLGGLGGLGGFGGGGGGGGKGGAGGLGGRGTTSVSQGNTGGIGGSGAGGGQGRVGGPGGVGGGGGAGGAGGVGGFGGMGGTGYSDDGTNDATNGGVGGNGGSGGRGGAGGAGGAGGGGGAGGFGGGSGVGGDGGTGGGTNIPGDQSGAPGATGPNGSGGANGASGAGGALVSLTGGAGAAGGGGGGAAAGPAIFVNAGTLTTINSSAASCSATPGSGGGAAGTADSTPVFNYVGTVNGVSYTATAGPIAGALSSAAPSLRRRIQRDRNRPR